MLNTPILFLIFNRLDTTLAVLKKIQEIKPKQLFIAADGPRKGKDGEKEKCEQVREYVINNINWDCDVKTLFRDINLGCGKAVSTAITWFFQHVEQGIILEDDCLPNDSFFYFCETLLNTYKDEERIFSISGNNFQNHRIRGKADYYFSIYSHIWGWATWRRAWNYYNFDMNNFSKEKTLQSIKILSSSSSFQKYWLHIMTKAYKKEVDTWDYQWLYTNWIYQKLTILPKVNLISNIGFNQEATHTTNSNDWFANLPNYELTKELTHPKIIKVSKKADRYTSKTLFNITSLSATANIKKRIKTIIKAILKKYYQ